MRQARTATLHEVLAWIARDYHAGRVENARRRARGLVGQLPGRSESWAALAQTAFPQEPSIVRTASQRALILSPGSSDGYVLLCQVLGEPAPAAARRQARHGLKAAPGALATNTASAVVELRIATGRPPISAARRPALLSPANGQAWSVLGDALLGGGHSDAAASAYRRALLIDPASLSALYAISTAGRPDLAADRLAEARDRAARAELAGEALEFAGFALAADFDRRGDTETAFHWYSTANAAHRAAYPPDMAQLKGFLDRSFAVRWPEVSAAGDRRRDGRLPIFIIGLPGSGTTLVESILSMHPAIAAAGELGLIAATAETIAGYPAALTELTQGDLDALATAYLDGVAQMVRTDSAYVTDKMPTNFFHLGLIRRLFPAAPILHVQRDAMAVAWSLFRRRFTAGHDYAYALDDIAEVIAIHDRFMAHWKALWPEAIHTVRFEDLTGETERAAKDIVAFIGLPWDPACLAFHEAERHVSTASARAVRRPADPAARDHWCRYAPHLEALRRKLGG